MINSETFIVKRDGKKEAFSLDKIKNAISKAFLSVGSFATQDVITNILSRVSISDGTSVEDIQKIYLPMGFSNFKIEGRGLGSALILEFLLHYMTRPEYQLHVREAVYLDNALDLF